MNQTLKTISSAIQTPQILSKILAAHSIIFQLSSRCLDIPMKLQTLSLMFDILFRPRVYFCCCCCYNCCWFLKAKDWVNLFCSLGNKRTGYGKKNVTCYMHSMVFHVPEAMKRHSNVKQFTGQGTCRSEFTYMYPLQSILL